VSAQYPNAAMSQMRTRWKWRGFMRVPGWVLIGLLRGYQTFLSPLSGPTCKYYPSCSAYAILAIQRHGALKGTGLAVWRVLRCNPWSPGGVDDVPPRAVCGAKGEE
jgi:putative membrane protein insertion efficiency factor